MGDHIDTVAIDNEKDLNCSSIKSHLHYSLGLLVPLRKDMKIGNGLYSQYLDCSDRYPTEYQ